MKNGKPFAENNSSCLVSYSSDEDEAQPPPPTQHHHHQAELNPEAAKEQDERQLDANEVQVPRRGAIPCTTRP